MLDFTKIDSAHLKEIEADLKNRYYTFKSKNINLDMSRGKPCPDQLDLSLGLLDCLGHNSYKSAAGFDCRNYGCPDGLPEAKKFFADYLEVSPCEIIIGGNSSLNMMHDTVVRAMLHGVPGSKVPWGRLPSVKFLCPSPGYDRHFAICEYLGIEMITVPMLEDGPDMDLVEKLAASDSAIKGIWCVPRYSNPTGVTCSSQVVKRLARMKTKAPDFRIFWDNAYAVHHLTDSPDTLDNILAACKEAGNPDRVYIFGSTAKISFAGAGVAMMASSETNINDLKKQIAIQTIGTDKINQLRHICFFKDMEGIRAHMKKHAAILKPKFDAVLSVLESQLGGKNIAQWSKPKGGYFISLDTMEGCAKEVVAMAQEAGVTFTKAGATYPYGKDPKDQNIRIAPSYPPVDELKQAIELLAICIQLVSIKKLRAV